MKVFLRQDGATKDLLSLVGVEVKLKEIRKWSDKQIAEVEKWAWAIYAKASDNSVKIPPRPKFLPNGK